MDRRTVIAIAAASALVLALPAGATEQTADVAGPGAVTIQLSASQIEALLGDNTIVGTWAGSGYKQYFGKGGFTMYIPDGGGVDEGKWRANADTNRYESWWRMTGWTPYTVVMTNDGYAWVNGANLEPFDVFQGKQVNW